MKSTACERACLRTMLSFRDFLPKTGRRTPTHNCGCRGQKRNFSTFDGTEMREAAEFLPLKFALRGTNKSRAVLHPPLLRRPTRGTRMLTNLLEISQSDAHCCTYCCTLGTTRIEC